MPRKEVLKNDPALYEEIETAVKAKLDEDKSVSALASERVPKLFGLAGRLCSEVARNLAARTLR